MRHPRYCLTHHPGISSNITNATHFSMLPTTPTLVHHRLYPHWSTTHVTHAGTQPTLARHPRWHVTHVSTPPTQTHHLRQHASHTSTPLTTPTLAQRVCHFSNFWVSNQLSNSKRKFSSFYFQFLFIQPLLFRPC